MPDALKADDTYQVSSSSLLNQYHIPNCRSRYSNHFSHYSLHLIHIQIITNFYQVYFQNNKHVSYSLTFLSFQSMGEICKYIVYLCISLPHCKLLKHEIYSLSFLVAMLRFITCDYKNFLGLQLHSRRVSPTLVNARET